MRVGDPNPSAKAIVPALDIPETGGSTGKRRIVSLIEYRCIRSISQAKSPYANSLRPIPLSITNLPTCGSVQLGPVGVITNAEALEHWPFLVQFLLRATVPSNSRRQSANESSDT